MQLLQLSQTSEMQLTVFKEYGVFISLGVSLYISFLLALFASFSDVFLIRKILHKKSFGFVMLFSTVFQLLFIILIIFITNQLFYFILFNDTVISYQSIFDAPDVEMLIILAFLAIVISRFILEVDQKLGKGNLWKFITGKFYSPRTENRIFMFLDLKSSTKIAEKIGHLRFSELLQDCFNDLAVVDDYYASVYQYVGDEVVLTWEAKKGIVKDNFINAYFKFIQKLESKRPFYELKYGIFPEFKAGAHIGECTVSEIGSLKREIAYSGDTINTAARIESMCNKLNADFLISEKLKNHFLTNAQFNFDEKGCVGLRGKSEKINLFNVEEI